MSATKWLARRGRDFVLTEDHTAIRRFETADDARPHGRPVLTGCPLCGKHADEYRGCDCPAPRAQDEPTTRQNGERS